MTRSSPAQRPDLLLTHAYHLCDDAREQQVMKPYPPLGILYVCAHLKAKGFQVAVHDTTFRRPEELKQALEEQKPPVVGIYGNLGTRRGVVAAIRTAKASGARVVLGGPEPPSYPEQYLDRGADVIVFGEGEETLEELLPLLLESPDRMPDLGEVAGVIFRRGGELVKTQARAGLKDLDAQPWPDRGAIDLERYVNTWRQHHDFGPVSMVTARGCPYECQWCSHGVFGYSHRRRSPKGTADEVEEIVARYKPDGLWYADDVFTINHKWLREYSAELDRRGLQMPFETITREDRLTPKVVELLAHMGCRRLWIGAESGSQKILDAMKRRTDAERTREMIHLVQSHGIEAGTFIMLGYEDETLQDLQDTVDHLKAALPDELLTTVSYPIKGTPYYEKIQDRLILSDDWESSTDRDIQVDGRHSDRYYRHAIRWITGEVARERARRRGGSAGAQARGFVNARLGRLGMWLARHETVSRAEGGGDAR